MKYILTEHALTKIEKRKIPLHLIEHVYKNPQQIIREEDLSVFQSIIELNLKEYLLRVFVNTDVEPNKIVTVYMTKNINKYMVK